MRIFLSTLIFSLLLFSFDCAVAQNLREDEVVVIRGEKYISHQVRTGETLFSISKKYNTSQQLIETLNPKVKKGLLIGEMLKIPFVEGTELQKELDQRGAPDGFKTYKIQDRKETEYSIAKKFNITVEDLYKYNPKVKKYKKRKKIKIPFWNEVEKEIEEELPAEPEKESNRGSKFKTHTVVSGETLYSLSKRYGVSQNEIIANNPGAENLKTGMILKIPFNDGGNNVLPEPIESDANVNYLEHIIESGETMWGITRKYGVSEAKLKALNPILETGFPAGVSIRIPIVEVDKSRAKPINEEAFNKHLVLKGETLYGLSQIYALSIPEIKKYNPVLESRNLVEGETILIPAKPDAIFEEIVSNNKADSLRLVEEFYEVELPVEIPQSCLPESTTIFKDKIYSVALFLPLFLEKNDTINSEIVIDTTALYTQEEVEIAQDTTIELEERKELFTQFYGGSENFVQFYEGVLIAIDTLRKEGVDVKLNVFDTERNAASIREYIYTDEFLATDLIIGPIYKSVQNEVAEIAAKNRIPIVSPLASQNTIANNNPNYYQVNPSRDYLANKTAEMVAEEYYNSNFIIVKTNSYAGTPEGRLVEMFQEKFFNSGFMSNTAGVNFTVYDYENEGAFGLRRIMSETKENVVYIPSSDEGKLSIAISNVNNLARDFSITLIGSNRYDSFSSIQLGNFHNLKLKYVAPYWVDYTNPSTIHFIEKFKSNFKTEPNNFGMQGYDVTLYFMTALTAFGNNFSDCLPYLHLKQVQGNYHFEKVSAFGGYMNQGVSVISYTKDYRVVRQRVMGQPRLVAGN